MIITYQNSLGKIIGIIVGVGGAASIAFSVNLCKADMVRGIVALCASCLAVTAVSLVSIWSTENNRLGSKYSAYGYLGTPDWNSNIFAWHPTLLVGGFFFSQVFAILSWSLFLDHGIAKIIHIVSQTAALATLISGVWAIELYKDNKKSGIEPSLVSMHSWIGVSTCVVFTGNYFFGMMMAILTRFCPTSKLRTDWNLKAIHRRFGLIALLLTTTAILSGIANQFGKNGCNYISASTSELFDANPANHYSIMPTACKVANGMGILVLLAACCTVLTVIGRDLVSTAIPHDSNPHPDAVAPKAVVVGDGHSFGVSSNEFVVGSSPPGEVVPGTLVAANDGVEYHF